MATSNSIASPSLAMTAARAKAEQIEKQRIERYWDYVFDDKSKVELLRELEECCYGTTWKYSKIYTAQLCRLARRAHSGQMVYEKFDTVELPKLCADRRISFEKSTSKDQLCKRLYDADASFEAFSKFMDLPPELRALVFDHYFDWLAKLQREKGSPSIDEKLRPPPITRVSRLIRKESLPLSQDRQTLELRYDYVRGPGYTWKDVDLEPERLLEAPFLRGIRKVYVDFTYWKQDDQFENYYHNASATLLLSLSKDASEAVIGPIKSTEVEDMEEPEEMWSKTEEKLREMVAKRIEEKGTFAMQEDDFEVIP